MADLIKRQDVEMVVNTGLSLVKSFNVGGVLNNIISGYEEVIELIKEIPSVEAEPVVRCKDCRHFYQLSQNQGKCEQSISPIAFPYTNSFCSFGEKKEVER